MTGWYDPLHLLSIAVRVAVSTVFGEFADRRESMAAAREIDPAKIEPTYDYSHEGAADFWLDFVADTGDGWDSTYAIARLLAQPRLNLAPVGGATPGISPADIPAGGLPAARVLVMGGDQVYPTASRDDYRKKLIGPYDTAAQNYATWPEDREPHVYAVPGNHDWYDGLSAFLGVFCSRRLLGDWSIPRKGRLIGGRRTQQTRSYFALALPQGWWLWGTDTQLSGYIDQPQIDFFQHVAAKWMPENSRVILCTGRPEWAYVDGPDGENTAFRNFAYMASLVEQAERGHKLRLVLTGDSHHYARYQEDGIDYFTAGGGGAFLHPTHSLEDKSFTMNYPAPGQPMVPGQQKYQRDFKIATSAGGEQAMFPAAAVSRALAWRNLRFFALNPQFAVVLGLVCGIFAWLLNGNAHIVGSTLPAILHDADGFWAAVWAYLKLVFVMPWPSLLVAAAAAGYCYFADFQPWWKRLLAGGLHTAGQTLTVVAASILLARYLPVAQLEWALVAGVAICGGILAPVVMGIYLLISLNVFNQHSNEAFSSLRIADYKNFLRIRIAPDGRLSVFPIGLTDTPKSIAPESAATDPALQPHLIEHPVHIS